jgi:hypothetical protein
MTLASSQAPRSQLLREWTNRAAGTLASGTTVASRATTIVLLS